MSVTVCRIGGSALYKVSNFLIEEYEDKDSHQFKSENSKTVANDDLPALQSGCDPAIVDELERLRRSNKKARCIANNGREMTLQRQVALHFLGIVYKFIFIESDLLVLLNYVAQHDPRCVWNDTVSFAGADQVSFSYALGDLSKQWHSITRDALVDASRALSSMNISRKKEGNVILHPGELKLVSIGFRGSVVVRQRIEQSQNAHRKSFLTAADWLVSNQDENGGWPVPVERAIADRRLVLPAGWYSAMAQGHGLSLLTRAYTATHNNSYLAAASKALHLFELKAGERGVRNELFGHVWFEEYPTSPGSFVLNGFMYSLIGLFDLSSVSIRGEVADEVRLGTERASILFSSGLDSLRALLPLYDTGSGSIYDLRHIGLHTAPNLARWDYHAVHVYLLKWLVQITGDKTLDETADRFIAYSWGKKAKHN
ncbi:unnamed protein product [Cylicocyclus nassatus]|uniref:heparosan-N-sulfate-glucuronate 5-epimerase n=1 Tax=Cylicocyclus nassatus TaxID=53992 RepID=A0AA36GW12_CYLNA|nr:unnamed protein product [Cylicocyclus nassatus]